MKKLLIIFTIIAWLPLAHASGNELSEEKKAEIAEKINYRSLKKAMRHYETGDYVEAFSILKPVAERGYSPAQAIIAIMYRHGQGVPQNDAEAVKWHRKSAKQGYVESQLSLAIMYDVGIGVSQNFIQAYMWASIAKANGSEEAKEALGYTIERMTTADISKAQELAKQCWESNYQNCGE